MQTHVLLNSFLLLLKQPLARLEQNGPGLFYVIRFRRQGEPDWRMARVDDQSSYKYRVDGTEGPYLPFDISVSAGNVMGTARGTPVTVTGYSGEDGNCLSCYASAPPFTVLPTIWFQIKFGHECCRSSLWYPLTFMMLMAIYLIIL